MLKILPQLFYETPEYQKILVDGLSCIIHKKVHEPVYQKEGYVSTHAITLVLRGTLRLENDNCLAVTVKENQMVFVPKGLYTMSDILPDNGFFEAIVFFFVCQFQIFERLFFISDRRIDLRNVVW